jgi:hypothetical protein
VIHSPVMRTMTIVQTVGLALATFALAGCTQAAEPEGPRVFFVQPTDGATVKSPVHLEFGAADFTIAAVPQEPPAETRPSLGHYHVAIDADCLPAGTMIPRAAPWVHFGDGKNVIDMQMPTGSHRLTLQIGDDLHRTIGNLCTTITVNVTE